MGEIDRIPAAPLALAVALAPIPASGIAALLWALPTPSIGLLRFWANLSMFGLGLAVLVGLPLALWLLRDAALPLWRWLGVGLLGGAIGGVLLIGWTALSSTRFLIHGQWGSAIVILASVLLPLAILSAALARLMLLAWLYRRAASAREG